MSRLAPTASLAANPGIAYPERTLARQRWYEGPVQALSGALARPVVSASGRYRDILSETARSEPDVRGLNPGQILERATGLGRELRLHGYRIDLVGQVFALAREAAGRVLGKRHFDVQMVGAWALLHGKIAEMDTGEGKTLTATLAAVTAALAGHPVHVITANDYLAERDAEELRPLYAAFGLSVGNPKPGMPPAQRQLEYLNNLVYCSNKEIAFDFLRDRIALGRRGRRLSVRLGQLAGNDASLEGLILRGLCFAIVDEADSVLVDEARTPLIISGSGGEAELDGLYRTAVQLAAQLREGRDFTLLPKERRIEIHDAGRARLADLVENIGGVWQGPRRREQLISQALSALHLFQRDVHYLVRDEKVHIIDEYTGRVLPDRSWEQGLHQMVEAKEELPVTAQKVALARTTYQYFFRRYLHLCGMSGTAKEIAAELHAVYGLDVVRVPTNRPSRRIRLPSQVFATLDQKWQAVAERVQTLQHQGVPVLIGTRTVEASQQASDALQRLGLLHRVLSASQDSEEAEIVASAGQPGVITVATNMAGRGTDIKLASGVAAQGGLQVLATELHDSRRIDRQLFGRCARQGDPGSHQSFLSLEDELIKAYIPRPMRALLAGLLRMRQTGLVALALRSAQKAAEAQNHRIRKQLLKNDENSEDALAFTGTGS